MTKSIRERERKKSIFHMFLQKGICEMQCWKHTRLILGEGAMEEEEKIAYKCLTKSNPFFFLLSFLEGLTLFYVESLDIHEANKHPLLLPATWNKKKKYIKKSNENIYIYMQKKKKASLSSPDGRLRKRKASPSISLFNWPHHLFLDLDLTHKTKALLYFSPPLHHQRM